jgi:hypothetical protein
VTKRDITCYDITDIQLTYIQTSYSRLRTGSSDLHKSESFHSFGSVCYKSLRIRKSDFHYEPNLRGTGAFRQKCLTCTFPPLFLLCSRHQSCMGSFLTRNSRTITLEVCLFEFRVAGQKFVGLLTEDRDQKAISAWTLNEVLSSTVELFLQGIEPNLAPIGRVAL